MTHIKKYIPLNGCFSGAVSYIYISAQYIIDSMAECTNVNLYIFFFLQFRCTHMQHGYITRKIRIFQSFLK